MANGGLGEIWWKYRAGRQKEFAGTVGILDARPDIVAGAEFQERLEKVAVFLGAVGRDFVRPQSSVEDQLPEDTPSVLEEPKRRLYMIEAVWRCWFSPG